MDNKTNLTKDMFERVEMDLASQEKISRPSLTFWQDAGQRLMHDKAARFAAGLLLVTCYYGFHWSYDDPIFL